MTSTTTDVTVRIRLLTLSRSCLFLTRICFHSIIQNTGSITEVQAEALLEIFLALAKLVIETLDDLIAKQAAFATLPVGGITKLIESDLMTLNKATMGLGSALIGACPVRVFLKFR